jgi:DNA-directed RNA polymerase specialized sigma24 family protein
MSDHAKEARSESGLWPSERRLSPRARRTLEARLDELLADAKFEEILNFTANEVKTNWRLPLTIARWTVLAALARPRDLTRIHRAWRKGKLALAKLIVRRRVFDLFRRERRKPHHSSFATASDGVETGPALFAEDLRSDQLTILEHHEGSEALRVAIECFASRGVKQQLQALLLWRVIDETPYAELSTDLACTRGALRVRVHKAIQALRRHVLECHCGHVH